MNDNVEMCAKALISWNLAHFSGRAMEQDANYNSQSFIAKVLRKKIEVFEIPIKIPDYLLIIIELCTGSNPGVSQVMLKEVMKHIPDLAPDHEITPMDFSLTYFNDFPDMTTNPKWSEDFSRLWDEQKSPDGQNLCDTREWWMECFKS